MPEIVLHSGVERRAPSPGKASVGTGICPYKPSAAQLTPALVPTTLSFSNVIDTGFPSFG
jgi:hypothetical protein